MATQGRQAHFTDRAGSAENRPVPDIPKPLRNQIRSRRKRQHARQTMGMEIDVSSAPLLRMRGLRLR
jgi:hypothetical protein